jgi:hypothetical protein
MMFGLSGCAKNTSAAVVSAQSNKSAAEKDNKINLNKLNITIPSDWTKTGNENEIFFDDENKQTAGGISVLGYYGDYKSSLPNHSEIINTEDIDISIGKGKIFMLKRSYPAASGNNETWTEIHAIIPSVNNLAYDIWVKGEKDILLHILKSIK